MNDRRPMRRPSFALDHRGVGLGLAVGAGLLAVVLLGVAPLALAAGLLALLVVD